MVDAAAAVVAVLTRAPSSGGKNRLFRTLGIPTDARLLGALLIDTLDGCATPGVRRVIAVTPGGACDEVRQMAAGIDVMPQAAGDLGTRMHSVMAALFGCGATAVALVGSDLPHMPPATIAAAFDVLARDGDALVLGRALDGGYYLIGARRLPEVFGGITWGSGRVFADTARAATAAGFRIHELPPLGDVDTADDLRAAVASGRAARTAAWVREHAPQLVGSG